MSHSYAIDIVLNTGEILQEVNSAWKGLGYYRRARSLLAGAKRVMSDPKYQGGCRYTVCVRSFDESDPPSGRLPDIPAVLEQEIEGIGRYTAGAICSMAYGVRTPIVSGK